MKNEVLTRAINALPRRQDWVYWDGGVEDEVKVVIQALSPAGSLSVEEELVQTIQAVALSYRLRWWSTFGYDKRPQRGGIFEPFVSQEQRAQQDFLFTELFLMTVVIFCSETGGPDHV